MPHSRNRFTDVTMLNESFDIKTEKTIYCWKFYEVIYSVEYIFLCYDAHQLYFLNYEFM